MDTERGTTSPGCKSKEKRSGAPRGRFVAHVMLHGKRSSGRRKRKITCQYKRAFDSFSGIVIYLDIFWLCDEPLEDTADLPHPVVRNLREGGIYFAQYIEHSGV